MVLGWSSINQSEEGGNEEARYPANRDAASAPQEHVCPVEKRAELLASGVSTSLFSSSHHGDLNGLLS